MVETKHSQAISELEKQGIYDIDVNAMHENLINANQKHRKYVYSDIFSKIYYGILKVLFLLLAPPFAFITYRLKVEGRENLRAARKTGAVSICNHVMFLESLLIKLTTLRQLYFISAAHNDKKGFGGYTLKIMGSLPLSTDFENQKKLDGVVAEILENKGVIHMNPEQAMWIGYEKIRPFKNGAFHYAVKNGKPVVPMLMVFRKTNKWDKFVGRVFKVTIKILPPVSPVAELPFKESVIDLRDRTRQAMIDAANAYYGYETDVLKLESSNENQ